jgi:serine/alanine adding enzyme
MTDSSTKENRILSVITLQENLYPAWNEYVALHSHGVFSHHLGWKNIIEKTYGHKTYYLMAVRAKEGKRSVEGVLPLAHLKHPLFGNSLISMPFLDHGGILADDAEVERSLLEEAVRLAGSLGTKSIELRHLDPISVVKANGMNRAIPMSGVGIAGWSIRVRSHKVRMLLPLPPSSELLMKSFKSKLRSQIQKPLKEGMISKIGGNELADDFYKVFCKNMRDLGSPVHSKELMVNILRELPNDAKIAMVYRREIPLACGLMIAFKDTMSNPWASSLREYRELGPNMLLYWTMLQYASDHGFKLFDLGRSSEGEGTYNFKEQWGARPVPLHWHYASNGHTSTSDEIDKEKFGRAVWLWQKMPTSATKIFGPMIRKYIPL